MLVLSWIVLSSQCVKFFYFVHRFREFCECFVVFFDKRIFFLWASCLSSLVLLLGVLFLLVVFRIQVVCVLLFDCLLYCGYIMRHALWVFPETTTTATLASVCETLQPLFCTIAKKKIKLRQGDT